MKKSTALLLAIGLFVAVTPVVRGFTITTVSSPCPPCSAPVMNDKGQMVWVGHDGVEYDIYFYDGTDILRLETPGVRDQLPQVNNLGQVVWEALDGSPWGIYFYDGSVIQKLTASGCYGNSAEINDSTVVVWSGSCNPRSMYKDIFIWQAGATETIYLPNCINITPQINNNGDIVWLSFDGQGWNVYLNSQDGPIRISDSAYRDTMPQINENGDLAWSGYDGTDWDIFFYDGNDVRRIENPGCYDWAEPNLNDEGKIVWEGFDGTDWEVFMYDGQTLVPLTANSFDDCAPQINSQGYVVWKGFDGLDWEVFLYDGTGVKQVTNNDQDDTSPRINDDGTIAWVGADGSAAAIFFTRVGDATPPVISSIEAPDMLWPPNHKMVPVTLSVMATDDSGDVPSSRIISVTSNEPESGCGGGDKSPDWQITGDLTLNLRAERCGGGDGRIYTITVECSDAAGNTATETVEVRVPHDMGKKK